MGKKIIFLFILICLFSCIEKNRTNVYYLEIDNKELEEQIISYTKIIKSENKNNSFIIRVFCIEVNDSTTRYIINGESDPTLIKMWPYHFICKVGNENVFFTMLSGIVRRRNEKNFFKLNKTSYLDFLKNYFPEDYKYQVKDIVKHSQLMYEPEMCYLTFMNNILVKKEMRRGLPWW